MSAEPSIAPPGSSSYSSNILHVGDGTWDEGRDDFLLPNVEGLPFAAMRFNGMGNRFRTLSEYHSLITAHGVIAAITFLAIVPTAILTASFYHRDPYFALRVHISLQTFTVILTTVIFVLGYFAVGPERSLTNPHHGIGLALYLFILLQAFGGWIIKRIEKGKIRYYIPIKLMLHQWLGRGIALLGLAQIPIGLTLYGSPKSLFVLYSLVVFGLILIYFFLVHQNHKRVALAHDERESYISSVVSGQTESRPGLPPGSTPGSEVGPERDRRHRLEEMAGAVGLGAAVAALRRRSSGQRRHMDRDDATSIAYSRPGAESVGGEKFTESSYLSEAPRRSQWRDRLLGPAVGAGAFSAARNLFRRRRVRDDDVPIGGPYGAPYQGPVADSSMNFHSMEEGRPMTPAANNHWRQVEDRERAQEEAQARGALQSRISEDSVETDMTPQKPGPRRPGRFGIPASLGALGAIGGLGGVGAYFKRRREQREDQRIETERLRDRENERIYGGGSAQRLYTGDGTPRRNRRVGSSSPLTDRNGSPNRGGAAVPSLGGRSLLENSPPRAQRTSIPPPPRSNPRTPQPPLHSSSPSSTFPAQPPNHRGGLNGNNVTQTSTPIRSPPAANVASGSLLSPPTAPGTQHTRTRSSSPHHDAVDSPPVSVKVKMHDDGRHVTLRRLGEEEAAREREARRREKRRQKQQAATGSDVSGMDDTAAGPSGFRRGPGTPYAGRSPQPMSSGVVTPAAQSQPSELHLPPGSAHGEGLTPPSGLGSSPLSGLGGTGTEGSDFDSNRRRRRAERARAEQQRQAAAGRKGGNRVEFS